MSILDDAIREHLELKRAHGADEAELKRLEDEAFGPPGRPEEPDPFAEAPTEFMTAPEGAGGEDAETGGRRIDIAALQEPPPAEPRELQVEEAAAIDGDAGHPAVPLEDAAQAAPPAEEEAPAEDSTVGSPGTDERQAIAEQPTELFDVEAEAGSEDAPAAAAPSPSDEEIVDAEQSEPTLAPVEPSAGIQASRTQPPEAAPVEEEEDEEFWSDQRLSEELDQALEAPMGDERETPIPTEEASTGGQESGTASAEAPEAGEDEARRPDYDPDTGHEDVLEDTPEFLEDAPEDDELWFEQRPPKDFDFDD